MTRPILVLAVLLALTGTACVGLDDAKKCAEGTGDAELDIDYCTRGIDSGNLSKRDLGATFNNRGNAYADKGEYGLAIADFDQAIRLKPDYALALANKGMALSRCFPAELGSSANGSRTGSPRLRGIRVRRQNKWACWGCFVTEDLAHVGFMLSRFLPMAQAAVSDCEFLDLSPPFDDGCAPPEVDVGGGEIAEAFVVSAIVVMLDEGVDMALKVATAAGPFSARSTRYPRLPRRVAVILRTPGLSSTIRIHGTAA